MKILYINSSSDDVSNMLKQFGHVTVSTSDSGLSDYQMVAVNGTNFNGNFDDLVAKALNAKFSLGVTSMTAAQQQSLITATGITPVSASIGALLNMTTLSGGLLVPQLRYMPDYSPMSDQITAGGLTVEQVELSMMQQGIAAQISDETLQSSNSSKKKSTRSADPPVTNLLIPTFSESPYGIITVPPKNFSIVASNLKNSPTISFTVQPTIYVYYSGVGPQPVQGSPGRFWFIIVTSYTNMQPAQQLYFSDFNVPSCGSCSFSYVWQQWFNFQVSSNILNNSGQNVQGLSVFSSSPANASAGQTTITDSVPSGTVFQMYVNNGGNMQVVNFNPVYSRQFNSSTNPNISSFAISNLDNPSNGTMGISFAQPQNNNRNSNPALSATLESVNICSIDATPAIGGSYPVNIRFNINFGGNQQYCDTTVCSNPYGPSYPVTNCSNSSNTQQPTMSSGLVDLVQLTAMKGPVTPPNQ
ncbi:MAG: hypothetical protein MUC87_07535 [Bacteroidia bacterium]|jgi:hypothetical protein|nr:hypothetical protein [Bacteroidia bacterium]